MLHLILFFLLSPLNLDIIDVPQDQYTKVTIEVRNENNQLEEVYSSTNPEDIKSLLGTLKGKSAPNFKCGYTGKIIFHGKAELYTADFNITSCNHIVYMKGDNLMSKHLSKKSLELIKSLTKK